ncbi:nucleoside 2-deoxyribosyltransferase [Candidatus Woesebacteria bacterium]|nr:nucleoside 2-deoxyribosyltransferase [Candidatus Woesebacteria bacterium]
MKIYVSYKYKGSDKRKLIKNLKYVDREITEADHKSYIYLRDALKWGKVKKKEELIIREAFKAIDGCDALLAIVESENLSEGMLLEIGYAYAKGKKIYLSINEKLEKDHLRFVRNLATKEGLFSTKTKDMRVNHLGFFRS